MYLKGKKKEVEEEVEGVPLDGMSCPTSSRSTLSREDTA